MISNRIKLCSAPLLKFSILLFSLILTGCQLLPSKRTQLPPLTHIDQIQQWTARGKMMVADNKEKVSGYFYWHQNQHDFEFSLDTLIGINIVAIEYQDGVATIEADGQKYQDSDPEQLVFRLTGHRMPIKELPNWFLAKLDKRQSMNAQAKYDSQARLTSFRYQGPINTWQISYGNWMTQDKISLPKSINLKSAQNRVKISISNWQIQG